MLSQSHEGMVQQHHLGKWFRKRYSNLLPKLYHSKHFKAVSSDIGRCISSAAVCAAGIYPPDDVEMWHPTLRWQPVPIYVSRDALLYQWIFCPKHRRLWTALKKSEVYQKILRENEGFLKFLTEKSGVDLNSLSAVRLLFGIFYDQRGFNVTFPDWIQSSYRKLQDLSRQLMISYTYTPELARLRSDNPAITISFGIFIFARFMLGISLRSMFFNILDDLNIQYVPHHGPLLGKIIKHFDNVISNSTELKFVLYSAHECTLINTLNSMGIYDYHVPEYSATLLFELRRDDIGVFVNILYKNSTKLYQLGLKECVFRCDLEQFRGRTASSCGHGHGPVEC
ncbi:hypothetical protein NQ317_017784 [Molorchus minor]|uniref:acid phosphatase n=1 Tax=Molorchus minor TaxID=1323400 RepID=A0ABQ9K1W2_9CUCU|nr:hypothetical protein NQ317_017784 [Molorchus minor]